MLNNKGQSLVLFILIIPILLGIMALVIDLGNAINQKNNLDNTIEYILNYGLEQQENNNLNEVDLQKILTLNQPDNNNRLVIENEQIKIVSTDYVEGIFSNILNINGFKIESEYIGYLENNKKIIKKIK